MSIEEKRKIVEKLYETRNTKPNVVCIGAYNRGKSSLLNALIGDFENKTFNVSDKRETMKIKSYEHNDIIYTDTPGLNADEKDDLTTMNEIKYSDVNIFVHSLSEGELDRQEINYIHSLIYELNTKQSVFDKTIFIINHIEDMSYDIIQRGIDRINTQIKQEFDIYPKILQISTTRYIKGMLENKQSLINHSGIKALQKELKKMCESENIKKGRNARLINSIDYLTNALNSKLNKNEQKFKNITEEVSKLQTKIESINTTITKMKERLM